MVLECLLSCKSCVENFIWMVRLVHGNLGIPQLRDCVAPLPLCASRVIIPWRKDGCVFLLSGLHDCLCVVMSGVSNDATMSFTTCVRPQKISKCLAKWL